LNEFGRTRNKPEIVAISAKEKRTRKNYCTDMDSVWVQY
jgi:hypothetical protein